MFWIQEPFKSVCRIIFHFAHGYLRTFQHIKNKPFLILPSSLSRYLSAPKDFTRIKLALRNQAQLAPFICYLDFKIGNFAFDVTEII